MPLACRLPLKGGVIPGCCLSAILARTGLKSMHQDLNSARAMASRVSFIRRFSSILSFSVLKMWAMARCSGRGGTNTESS